MKKGLRPILGDGAYEVETTQGTGIMYYHEKDDEWYNVEVNGEIQSLEGRVINIGRRIFAEKYDEYTVN